MRPYFTDDHTTVYSGDALEVLRSLPSESIDSVVTDPPYGLTELSAKKVAATLGAWLAGEREFIPGGGKGFMSARWDRFVPPPALWDEAFRLLKPGAYLAAFAGARTQDLMGMSIRLAGFEIQDELHWLRADCFDDETEVLTEGGWVRGLDLSDGTRVMQWTVETGELSLVHPTARVRYYYQGEMVKFRSRRTDQLLTPNHRVYIQRYERKMEDGVRVGWWSPLTVESAGKINRWQRIRMPVAGRHNGPGIGGEDYAALLGWILADGHMDKKGRGIRLYQSSVNPHHVARIDALLAPYKHSKYGYENKYKDRTYTYFTWYFTGDLADNVRRDIPGKKPTYELLWNATEAEKRAMYRALIDGDGTTKNRHICFSQKDPATLEWFQVLLACIGMQGKVGLPPIDPVPGGTGGYVSVVEKDATVLARSNLREAREGYSGEVWCLTVPSGALMVRRRGRVFISGNCFAKAKSALASGYEPILLARKPGGTHALNIDESRTPFVSAADEAESKGKNQHGKYGTLHGGNSVYGDYSAGGVRDDYDAPGRWPKNLLLEPTAAAALDAQNPPSVSRRGSPNRSAASGDGWGMTDVGAEYDDEGGPSRFYPKAFYSGRATAKERPVAPDGTKHPTVKPLSLMDWLVRLITPAGGIILDMFAGSGTTVEAARNQGFTSIAVENHEPFLLLIAQRIERSHAD